MPPAEYVLQKRLQRAVKLLTKTASLPIKEVAILSGFDDPNYFAKVFRRVFGANPTEFRTTGMYASLPVKARKTATKDTHAAAGDWKCGLKILLKE